MMLILWQLSHCFFNQTLPTRFELTNCLDMNLLDQSQKHITMLKYLPSFLGAHCDIIEYDHTFCSSNVGVIGFSSFDEVEEVELHDGRNSRSHDLDLYLSTIEPKLEAFWWLLRDEASSAQCCLGLLWWKLHHEFSL